MSEHPGDNVMNRFQAFWAGLLAFLSFGVVLWLVLLAAGPRGAVVPGAADRAEIRSANLREYRAAQRSALAPESIEAAMGPALAALQARQAGKSGELVPGSPTFMKQSQAPAAAAPEPDAGAAPAPDAAAPPPAGEGVPAAVPAPALPAPAPAEPVPAPAAEPAPAVPAPAAPAPAPVP